MLCSAFAFPISGKAGSSGKDLAAKLYSSLLWFKCYLRGKWLQHRSHIAGRILSGACSESQIQCVGLCHASSPFFIFGTHTHRHCVGMENFLFFNYHMSEPTLSIFAKQMTLTCVFSKSPNTCRDNGAAVDWNYIKCTALFGRDSLVNSAI